MFAELKNKIKNHPRLKSILLRLIVHPVKTRPQWWIRLFCFAYIKKGKGAVIYQSVRKDLVPFNRFSMGKKSIVESYSCLNNMVGDIIVGDYTRIGLHNTIIGPVTIGNNTNLAQNITVSGLNHIFQNPEKTIAGQGITTSPIHIGDDVWIGANSIILAGVEIGQHTIIAAGTVVTRSIPPYSVCAGNPGRIIKQYDFEKKDWIKLNSNE